MNELLNRLAGLQAKDGEDIPRGNFPSYRYHAVFRWIRRKEDNVYFVSWILQLLKRCRPMMSAGDQTTIDVLITEGEQAVSQYRNRYGDKSYNFYRPKAWFPNGLFLSRFVRFQPTDDSDDTSIAMRGRAHDREYAQEIKETYQHQSNGLRGRWIARCPKEYRRLRAYNTWIGSEGLFVDFDLVVMANILVFNAQYALGIGEEDRASLDYIDQCLRSGDAWKRSWAVSCWYPTSAVIIYSLADLLETDYYPEIEAHRDRLLQRCTEALDAARMGGHNGSATADMHETLYSIAYIKLSRMKARHAYEPKTSTAASQAAFSFGVVPLTHPWDGLVSQWLGGRSLFRMHYECEAQCLAIDLEWQLLSSMIGSN